MKKLVVSRHLSPFVNFKKILSRRSRFRSSAHCALILLFLGAGSTTIFAQSGVCFLVPNENRLTESSGSSVTNADFNNDGIMDLASSDGSVLLGTGTGNYIAAANILTGSFSLIIVAGHFTGDNNIDLVTADYFSNNVSVFAGDGNGGFAAAINQTVGGGPRDISIGDYNNDGKMDLAVANSSDGNTSILLGNGDGTFATAINFAVGSSPRAIVSGLFNGDANLDLAVLNEGSNNVSILIGDGTGAFASPVNYAVGSSPKSITSADFNSDGELDLAVANSSSIVSFLLGAGNGTFGTASSIPIFGVGGQLTQLKFITSADLDGDGNHDLVLADEGDVRSIKTLIGDGAGNFGLPMQFVTNLVVSSIAISDFNGDNRKDLVTGGGGLHIYPGKGDGSFSAPAMSINPGTAYSSAAGDFNGDGKKDLAVPNRSTNQLKIFFNDGLGNLYFNFAANNFATGTSPVSITSADYNNDGNLDLAVANNQSSNVSIFMGDGTGNFAAAVNFTVGTNPIYVVSGDFNNDNKIDLAVANSTDDNISILIGNGSGGFASAVNFNVGDKPMSIVINDFNEDNEVDLAVGNETSGDISILLGDGTGSFVITTIGSGSLGSSSLVTDDFNGDNNADIVVEGNGAYVFFGNADGTFSNEVSIPIATNSVGLTSADLNEDGFKDLAIINSNNTLTVLINNGNGNFVDMGTFTTDLGPLFILSEDFNDDGKSDLVVTHSTLGVAKIYVNSTAHITASGAVEFCAGGSVSLNANTTGTAYLWFPGGETTSSITVTTSGTYSVMISNFNGSCSSISNSITVIAENPATPVVAITQPTCDESLGTITVTEQNAGDTYSFDNGSNFQASNFKSELDPGSYYVIIKNTTGCNSPVATALVEDQPSGPSAPAITIIHPTCAVPTATITIEIQNADDTYTISNNSMTIVQTSNIFSGLIYDPFYYHYFIFIKNAAGCESFGSVELNGPPPSAAAAPDLTITQPNCDVSTGSIEITIENPDFTYSFDGGTSFQAGNILSEVAPDGYSVQVKDSDGCISETTYAFIDNQPLIPPVPYFDVTHPQCEGGGAFSVNFDSPSDHEFSIDNGVTFTDENDFIDVAPGEYTVLIRNSVGCTNSAIVIVNDVLDKPATPELLITQASCDGLSRIEVVVQNADDTYSFDNGLSFNTGNSRTGLAAGTYMLIIKNTSGCKSAVAEATVNAQPTSPTVPEIISITQPTCSVAKGTITINVQNANDTYSFDNGVTFQSSNSKSDLVAGEYQVKIKNIEGCVSILTAANVNVQPPIPVTPTVTLSLANPEAPLLTSSSSDGNQWFSMDGVSGEALDGANNETYTVMKAGVYFVVVTLGGCSSQPSANVPLIITGDISHSLAGLQLYPNPVKDILIVDGVTAEAIGQVFDMKGDLIYSPSGNFNGRMTFNVSQASQGIYLVRIIEGDSVRMLKFIKN